MFTICIRDGVAKTHWPSELTISALLRLRHGVRTIQKKGYDLFEYFFARCLRHGGCGRLAPTNPLHPPLNTHWRVLIAIALLNAN